MIIIPEIETVLILVPRTGTSSLIKAVKDRYSESMRIYRHMEADGIPAGYEHWRKVGIVRDPLERLWSLYKYLQTFDGPYPAEYIASQRESVSMPFPKWLHTNKIPFTQPYDSSGLGQFFPRYNVKHNLPENEKSQYYYLRPDLGTVIYDFKDLKSFGENVLKVSLPHINSSLGEPLGLTSRDLAVGQFEHDVVEHMIKWFSWDIGRTRPSWASNETLDRAMKRVLELQRVRQT